MKSVTKLILATLLITIVTISVFGLYSLNRYHDSESTHESVRLEACIRTFWQLLSHHGNDFRIVDNRLMVGSYVINGNFELPDRIQDIFGGVATVFMGDERVATNVLTAEGKRAVGTKLVGPAYDAIFKYDKPYRGRADILGIPYMTAYDPITDKDGKTIGALFVGVKESDFLARLHGMKNRMTVTLLSMLTALTFFMVLVGLAMNRIQKSNINQFNFQRTLMDTIPNPIFYKDNNYRYLGCNKAFEEYVGRTQQELIGKTPAELWQPELAAQYLQQDQDMLTNPGMRTYETSVMHADGRLRDVIFNKGTFTGKDGTVAGLVGVILDITERKQSENALKFQNILLTTQQEASIDGILVVDENGGILSYNQRFIEIMEIPRQLLEGSQDEPVLNYVTTRMTNPQAFIERVRYLYEHKQECARDEITLIDGKTLDRYTVPLLGPDGHYYGRLWSFRDITERAKAAMETMNAYQQLFDIVEFFPDATFVVDKSKKVIAWNRAIENMTGVSKQDILGKGDYAYAIPFYNDSRPLLIDLLGPEMEQERIRLNYTHIKQEGQTLFTEVFVPSFRNGDSRYFWATATPLFDSAGSQVGGIESIRDITDYKRTEDEKIRLESQLSSARLMETIMIRLGHDLKTPLTPLFILLPLLKKQLNDPEQLKKIETCIKSAVSIKNLADKTGILARLSSGAKLPNKTSISLAALADQSIADCALLISQKQITCRNLLDPDLAVHAVQGQMHELLKNLIGNAAYFSNEQGTITISGRRGEGFVTFSIHDDGVGIAPAHLEHVFDEFFKADESRHNLETSGLGLSICKRIAQKHRGRIWAESPGLGQGTTVHISIPDENFDKNITEQEAP